ncbi:hypothetical protein JCM10212_003578 [Sporobolomyces blumeae]
MTDSPSRRRLAHSGSPSSSRSSPPRSASPPSRPSPSPPQRNGLLVLKNKPPTYASQAREVSRDEVKDVGEEIGSEREAVLSPSKLTRAEVVNHSGEEGTSSAGEDDESSDESEDEDEDEDEDDGQPGFMLDDIASEDEDYESGDSQDESQRKIKNRKRKRTIDAGRRGTKRSRVESADEDDEDSDRQVAELLSPRTKKTDLRIVGDGRLDKQREPKRRKEKDETVRQMQFETASEFETAAEEVGGTLRAPTPSTSVATLSPSNRPPPISTTSSNIEQSSSTIASKTPSNALPAPPRRRVGTFLGVFVPPNPYAPRRGAPSHQPTAAVTQRSKGKPIEVVEVDSDSSSSSSRGSTSSLPIPESVLRSNEKIRKKRDLEKRESQEKGKRKGKANDKRSKTRAKFGVLSQGIQDRRSADEGEGPRHGKQDNDRSTDKGKGKGKFGKGKKKRRRTSSDEDGSDSDRFVVDDDEEVIESEWSEDERERVYGTEEARRRRREEEKKRKLDIQRAKEKAERRRRIAAGLDASDGGENERRERSKGKGKGKEKAVSDESEDSDVVVVATKKPGKNKQAGVASGSTSKAKAKTASKRKAERRHDSEDDGPDDLEILDEVTVVDNRLRVPKQKSQFDLLREARKSKLAASHARRIVLDSDDEAPASPPPRPCPSQYGYTGEESPSATSSSEEEDESSSESSESDEQTNLDADLNGFIQSEDEDAEEAARLVFEVREDMRGRTQSLNYHLKTYLLYLVHFIAAPEVDWLQDPGFKDAQKRVYAHLKGIIDSLLTSAAWLPKFKHTVNTRPDLRLEEMESVSKELRPPCDACSMGHVRSATLRTTFSGPKYARETLRPLDSSDDSSDSDSDSDSSSSDSESVDDRASPGPAETDPQKKKQQEARRKEKRRKKEFSRRNKKKPSWQREYQYNLGRQCATRAQVYSGLHHWPYKTYKQLNVEVKPMLKSVPALPKRSKVSKEQFETVRKRRQKEAGRIAVKLEEKGFIPALSRTLENELSQAIRAFSS